MANFNTNNILYSYYNKIHVYFKEIMKILL